MDSLLTLLAIYCLPTIVALGRKHPSIGGIAVVNLLLGWTIIGWVGSLAWAASAVRRGTAT